MGCSQGFFFFFNLNFENFFSFGFLGVFSGSSL